MEHKCQICQRLIDDSIGIAHVKAEEYIINLIRRDHPEWDHKDNTCHKCVEYYRRLVKETKI